jgi:hypothetical protein
MTDFIITHPFFSFQQRNQPTEVRENQVKIEQHLTDFRKLYPDIGQKVITQPNLIYSRAMKVTILLHWTDFRKLHPDIGHYSQTTFHYIYPICGTSFQITVRKFRYKFRYTDVLYLINMKNRNIHILFDT